MTLVTSKGESDVIYGSNSITLNKNKMDLNEIVSNNEEENQKRSFDNQ